MNLGLELKFLIKLIIFHFLIKMNLDYVYFIIVNVVLECRTHLKCLQMSSNGKDSKASLFLLLCPLEILQFASFMEAASDLCVIFHVMSLAGLDRQ